MEESCENCRYRKRSRLKDPCSTGTYQLYYSKRCFLWKPMRWWQNAVDLLKKK